ncbi:prolipoprotein diacylglyceryl transferase [Candidatus Daviesbacteria bacterium]|nr:prolipoprotein diacylglyceryl transferase [Candidatus Daviesbacteria bacterium]
MLPVLFSVGQISISSFGFFLALGFLFGTFLVWRLARAWDLDEEKILDLVLLTFFGGLLGARLFFISFNWDFFSQNPVSALLLTKYPGLEFWGGVLGGWLTLAFFSRRLKVDFWQIADLSAVGFLGGLVLGDIGCFLGGCAIGLPSNLFFATTVVGTVGKRFPIQLFEAAIFLIILLKIWPIASKFHFRGKIISLSLILLGVVKFLMDFFRAKTEGGQIFAMIILILGMTVFYKTSKRSFSEDIILAKKLLVSFLTENNARKTIIINFKTNWYNGFKSVVQNSKISWNWRIYRLKKLLRRWHVKHTPENIR